MSGWDDADSIGLLVLDFAGVCTPAMLELTSVDPTHPIPIRAGIVPLVSEAKNRQITVAILSNEISVDWALSEDVFSLVDHVIACSDNRIFKPDRRAFQRCLLLTGCEASQTLVVDDEADNIAVAGSLGMQTVLFDTSSPDRSLAEANAKIRA